MYGQATELHLPQVQSFRQLFREARLFNTSKPTDPRYYYIDGTRTGVIPSLYVRGYRGIEIQPDGSVLRKRYGRTTLYHTCVVPTFTVKQWWQREYGLLNGLRHDDGVLDSFEVIKRRDGYLVIAHCTHHVIRAWLALIPLEAGNQFMTLFPERNRALIAHEQAEDELAWGHLITAWNGKEYADPSRIPPATGKETAHVP